MKLVKYFFVVVSLSTLSISFSFAAGTVFTCPGVTRSVSWSSTNTTTGDCTGLVSGGGPGCSLSIQSTNGGPSSVTAPTSGTCTGTFTCKGVTDTATLSVVNSSSCCNTGSQVGLPYWNGSSCTPYTDAWCQASPRFYDVVTNPTLGYCGCTSPRTYVGGKCTCPSGTTWNGVWGAGATCTNPTVNGSCSATLNACYAGTSVDTADSATYYYWQCQGSGGGTTASCSKLKPCANGAGNPPTCTPLPTVNLTADSIRVSYNTGTTLRWTTTNSPTSCTATVGWTGSKAVGGGNQATGNLTATQTYRLQCGNAGGSSALASVTVTPCGAAAPNWNGTAHHLDQLHCLPSRRSFSSISLR